jgi:hypothetical protein
VVAGCGLAPGRVSRLTVKLAMSVLSARNAAEARLNIECGPGIGPSASMSVLT